MTRPSHDIGVRVFHHTLLWPLLLRIPDEEPSDGETFRSFLAALRAHGWAEPAADRESVDPRNVAVDPAYTYAEVVYFHPFVRDFLFGNGKETTVQRSVRRLTRADVTAVTIGDLVPHHPGDRPDVTFRVERTELLLIRPRVAMLLVEISNRIPLADLTPDQRESERGRRGEPSKDSPRTSLTLSQVLLLQSHLRHIYPPFFTPAGGHGDAMKSVEWVGLTAPSKYSSYSPRGEFEDFTKVGGEPPVYAHWRAFLGESIAPMESACRKPGELVVQQLLDDRMPALSFIAVDNPDEIAPEDQDRLPAFDPPSLSYEEKFRDGLRSGLRYDRFRHLGTTYYCNGACFAAVTNVGPVTDVLLGHFRRHYTHLAVIAQYQHAALLYFADELADAAKTLAVLKDGETAYEDWARRVRRLRRRFLKFLSRSYFREVSNQLQAKDLFGFWFRHLGTEQLLTQVSATNQEVYETLENHEARELAQAQTNLARVATGGFAISLVPSVVGAVFAFAALYAQDRREAMALFGPATVDGWVWFWLTLGGGLTAAAVVAYLALAVWTFGAWRRALRPWWEGQ